MSLKIQINIEGDLQTTPNIKVVLVESNWTFRQNLIDLRKFAIQYIRDSSLNSKVVLCWMGKVE
jgi:hypothetical protein